MRESIEVVTKATATDIVSVAEMKTYLRIESSDDDTIIGTFIDSAVDAVQQYLRRTLITSTYRLTLDAIPRRSSEEWWDGMREGAVTELTGGDDYIILPMGPLLTVTSMTTYGTDNSGTVFAASNYFVDTAGDRLCLDYGAVWPTSLRDQAAIEIEYTAGYGASKTAVPGSIIQAVMKVAAKMYEDRGCDCMAELRNMETLSQYRRMDSLQNGY